VLLNTVNFHYRRTLSAGTASASGQQDVGHEGVATGRRVLSLPSLGNTAVGSSDSCWDCDYSSHRKHLFPLESPPFVPINKREFPVSN